MVSGSLFSSNWLTVCFSIKENQHERQLLSWSQIMVTFGEETSFSGIRNITSPASTTIRKYVIWFALIITTIKITVDIWVWHCKCILLVRAWSFSTCQKSWSFQTKRLTNCNWRLVWLALFLAALALFGYLFYEKVHLLLSNPSQIDINVVYEDVLPFPSVTVCNANPYRSVRLRR